MPSDNATCNILVIGKTGVGKSTLINAVFGEDVAKTGIGARITEGIQEYNIKSHLITPLIKIYDTPGLQLFSREEIANLINTVSRLIKTEPIHIVWYCINAQSNRFEKTEEDWIREISTQEVPIILILTKAISDNNSEFLDYLKKQELPIVEVIPVLAQPLQITPKFTVPAWGLEILIKVTASNLPEVAKNPFAQGQKVIPWKKLLKALGLGIVGAAAITIAIVRPRDDY
jgi:small GTP-binding protein